MLQGKVLIAQGGGPTAVINQSLVGAVLAARGLPAAERVYGARHGVAGIVDEDFLDLTEESPEKLESVAASPGSALGSTRDKPDLKYCQEIFRVLQAHGIGSFFYIGGNDSADTVRIVRDEADKAGYRLRAVHVPKTVDNDLMLNDHTPGYPSAARFVASAFAGVDLDNRALPGVYVGVVMGRHAGFLTAAAAAARAEADDGPHLVYLPERDFDTDQFLSQVRSVYGRLGRCVIAVSEGIHDADGVPIAARLVETVERDAHGNIQLSGTGALADSLTRTIKDRLAIKRVRGDTFGYLQRSFLGCVSDVDRREAREAGEQAVRFAHELDEDGTVTIRRVREYGVEYRLDRLEEVAGKTRTMPDAFIAGSGADVTDAFVSYLRPLLGSDMPGTARLRAPAVAKVLAS
jgi:6-phosphofructokinase 1